MRIPSQGESDLGDEAPDFESLFKYLQVLMFLTRHKVLRLRPSKPGADHFLWRPLLERMEAFSQTKELEKSGIVALRVVTEIWDERMRQIKTGEKQPAFSAEQRKTMADALGEYEAWLRENFPEAFIPVNPGLMNPGLN